MYVCTRGKKGRWSKVRSCIHSSSSKWDGEHVGGGGDDDDGGDDDGDDDDIDSPTGRSVVNKKALGPSRRRTDERFPSEKMQGNRWSVKGPATYLCGAGVGIDRSGSAREL